MTTPPLAIHWEQRGTGHPLVLLHGLGGDTGFWQAHVPALAAHHTVIAIDLRGSGLTPASHDGHEIEDLADDVAAVLDDLDIRSAHVVGFSMGGYVAQAFAVRHADRLDRLVLAATSARLNAKSVRFIDAVLDAWESGISPAQMFALVAPWLFSADFVADDANAPLFEFPVNDPLEQSLDSWRKLYLAQRRFDGTGALAAIAAPTLVLLGSEDDLVTTPEGERFAAAISGSHFELFDGSGHLLNVEEPDRFVDTILAFLDTAHTSTTPTERDAS